MSDRQNEEKLVRIIEADSQEDAEMKLHKEYKISYENYKDRTKSISFEYDYHSSSHFEDLSITSSIK